MGRDMWGGKKKSGSRVLETDRHLGARAHAVHHREQLVERVLVFIAPSAAQADRIEGRALRVERIESVENCECRELRAYRIETRMGCGIWRNRWPSITCGENGYMRLGSGGENDEKNGVALDMALSAKF